MRPPGPLNRRIRIRFADSRGVEQRVRADVPKDLSETPRAVLAAVLRMLCGYHRVRDDRISVRQLIELCRGGGYAVDEQAVRAALDSLHRAELLVCFPAAQYRRSCVGLAIHERHLAGVEPLARNDTSIPVAADTPPVPGPEHADPDAHWDSMVSAAAAAVEKIEELNEAQRGASWARPVDPAAQSAVPVWTGRTAWLEQVRTVLGTDAGIRALGAQQLSARRCLLVADAMAACAQTRTGRGVTAAVETIAGKAAVSKATAKRARRVLRAIGMAVEMVIGGWLSTIERQAAEAHHGGRQIAVGSVWHLTSPGPVVAATAVAPVSRPRRSASRGRVRSVSRIAGAARGQGKRRADPLSSSSLFGRSSSFDLSSPTRERAGKVTSPDSTRSIGCQKAAAELLRHCPTLDNPRLHIGAVCDLLAEFGLDDGRWSGREIAAELTRDTVSRGWVWPKKVSAPVPFLRWRLARIDWNRLSPSEAAELTAQKRAEQQAMEAAARAAAPPPATAEHVRRICEEYRRAHPPTGRYLVGRGPTPLSVRQSRPVSPSRKESQ
ncbi:replication protein [Aldersonia sp. NBC_00410]|uniref:replication protein n=1 Tax=Aldersonia sp. NBC_00410 TaxID=2975954 RepID=UPI00224CD0C3|nr:replication protein [Aldersonia sp. NBC_00410]MCX5046700.1 replication protein [Aldersonia sp. NBC_00410]